MRSGAQMISYEISLGLAMITIIVLSGTMNINELVWQQESAWFIFRGHIPAIIAFLIYIVAATAETNRGPFDLPEAEHELTAGYHTEYSGIHFGFFYLAEYLNLFIVSGIDTSEDGCLCIYPAGTHSTTSWIISLPSYGLSLRVSSSPMS